MDGIGCDNGHCDWIIDFNFDYNIEEMWMKSKKRITLKEKNKLPIVKHGVTVEKKKYQGLSWRQRRKLKKKPETSFLIKMYFSNGTSKEFVISSQNETFDYLGRTFYLRYEDSWFNLTQNQYELNYFDDYPVPLDREITRKGEKSYWSVTSSNLKPIIKMEYVKALASAQTLDRYLKLLLILGIVTFFMMISVLVFVWQSTKVS